MAAPKPYDLGVLFVHGIGLQTRADTMVTWGEALRKCLGKWISGAAGGDPSKWVEVSDAQIRQDPADLQAPAHSQWTVTVPKAERPSRWLVAESCWAEVFARPRYADLASWSFRILPWTVVSHFGARLQHASVDWRGAKGLAGKLSAAMPVLAELAYFLIALALMPLMVAVVLLLLVVGSIPIAKIRSVAGALQGTLVGTVGDSFVLLDRPIEAAAITGRVRRDLAWLSAKCTRVAIVAHSQGVAVTHAVLRSKAPREVRLFVTAGSGLNKLTEIRQADKPEQRWMPWLAVAGLLVMAASIQGFLHLWQGVRPFEEVGLLALYVALASLALRIRKPGNLPRNVSAVILGLVALTACGIFFYRLMSGAEPMTWVFAAGIAMLVKGAAPGLQRGPENAEPLGLRRIRWLDFYASADPVPNGPLREEARARTRKIYNRGSALSDHTTYWENQDGFVSSVARALARVARIRLDALGAWDPECIEVAGQRRWWRMAWLRTARLVVVLLAGGLMLARWRDLASIVAAVPASILPAAYWIGRLAQKVMLIPDSWSLQGVRQADQWIGAGVVVLAALLMYWALYRVWTWWTAEELETFFARRDFRVITLPSGIFSFLLLALLECGVFVALRWEGAMGRGLLLTLKVAAVTAAFSVFPRVLGTILRDGPVGVIKEHGAVVAGRAALGAVLLAPVCVWEAAYYPPLVLPGSWMSTGSVSGFCLVAWLAILAAAKWIGRSTAAVKLRRFLEAWSYSGQIAVVQARLLAADDPRRQDILLRRARQLVTGGGEILAIQKLAADEAAKEGVSRQEREAIQRAARKVGLVVQSHARYAQEVASLLDPVAHQQQIQALREFAGVEKAAPMSARVKNAGV